VACLAVLNRIHPSRATPAIISGVAVQGGPSRGGLPDQVHNILNAAREYAYTRLERDVVRLGCLTPDHCAVRTLNIVRTARREMEHGVPEDYQPAGSSRPSAFTGQGW